MIRESPLPALAISAILLSIGSVRADDFSVTSLLDDGSPGSLRWAILQANGTGGADTITIIPGTITLLSGLPSLTGSTLIQGSGQGNTIIEGGPTPQSGGVNWRVFGIPAGANITMRDLTARNGVCEVTGTGTAFGGGIHNGGTLTLENVTISGNRVVNVGTPTSGNTSQGGGVSNAGTLNLLNCTISDNRVTGGAGSTAGGIGRGGGIYSSGTSTLNITDTTISDNRALGGTGGATGGTSSGGGLNVEPGATVNILNSTISGNLTAGGTVALGSPGSSMGGGVAVMGDTFGEVLIRMSTISGNNVGTQNGFGGGLSSGGALTIDSCTISNNTASTADTGGGLYVLPTAPTTGPAARNSILSGNLAAGSANDFKGRLNSQGFLLVTSFESGSTIDTTSPGNSGIGNQLNIGADLLPLAHNNGRTFTHALSPNSAALNTGTDVFVGGAIALIDQRGFPRVSIGQRGRGTAQADIGSYELQGPGSAVTRFDSYD